MKKISTFYYVWAVIGIIFVLSGCAAYDAPIYSSTTPAASTPTDWSYTNEGIKLYNEGRTKEALEKFTQSLNKWPNDWISLSWRASSYIDLGMYDQGLADLDLCFKLEPDSQHTVTYNWRGNAYAGMGDLDKALENFKLALDYKKSGLNHYRLADIYTKKSMYDEATVEYTNTLNHPDDADMIRLYGSGWKSYCYAGRGRCYYEKGLQDKAKEEAKKVIDIYPRFKGSFGNDPLSYYDIEKRNSVTKAALDAAKGAEANGDMLEAFNQLDKAYQWSAYSDAEDQKLIVNNMYRIYPQLSLKPTLPEAARRFYVQAQTLTENKNYDKALDAYNRLIAVAPWYPETWFNAAMIRVEKKEYPKAIANMKKYIQLAPDAPDARTAQDYIYKWEVLMNE